MEFYSLFYKGIYNSSLRILGDSFEAEEVMQETFMKVFKQPELYEADAVAMKKKLNRIAINHSIDIYRKRKVRFVELNENNHLIPDEQDEAELEDISIEAIYQMINLLPDGYRLIVNLHLIEGIEYDEIAENLQLSATTIRSQFSRARQKLIQLIKENYNYEYIRR
ncbi:RNA polymerase sigma factor [Odoribacter sp. OttesenSCG-928-J03]|nr:RNA polymerase sigma factor [Odoribacter sp. OttesenSCG-928-J03]MDL2283363.1 RNA polymerase sigma factor [Odoribacter sp. OttesenSCG-928-G04]